MVNFNTNFAPLLPAQPLSSMNHHVGGTKDSSDNQEQTGVMVDMTGKSFVGKKRPMETRPQDITNQLHENKSLDRQFAPIKYSKGVVHPLGGGAAMERTNTLLEKERRMRASKWAAPFNDSFNIVSNTSPPRGFGEKLAAFTGNFPLEGRKMEQEAFFEPSKNEQLPLMVDVEKQRFFNSQWKQKEKLPESEQQVSANVDLSNTYLSMYPSIDETRTLTNRKTHYSFEPHQGQIGTNRGLLPNVVKKRPPRTKANRVDDMVKTGGVILKTSALENFNFDETNRSTTTATKHNGPAVSTHGNVNRIRSTIRDSQKIEHLTSRQNAPVGSIKASQQTMTVYENERDTTTVNDRKNAVEPTIKKTKNKLSDTVRSTGKEISMQVNHRSTIFQSTGNYVKNMDTIRYTNKETIPGVSSTRNLATDRIHATVHPSQQAKPTIEDTLPQRATTNIQTFSRNITHNPNDTVKLTARETIHEPFNTSISSILKYNTGINDSIKTTIKQLDSNANTNNVITAPLRQTTHHQDTAIDTVRQTIPQHTNTHIGGNEKYTVHHQDTAVNTLRQTTLAPGISNVGIDVHSASVQFQQPASITVKQTLANTTLSNTKGNVATYVLNDDKPLVTTKQININGGSVGHGVKSFNRGITKDINDKAKHTIRNTVKNANHTSVHRPIGNTHHDDTPLAVTGKEIHNQSRIGQASHPDVHGYQISSMDAPLTHKESLVTVNSVGICAQPRSDSYKIETFRAPTTQKELNHVHYSSAPKGTDQHRNKIQIGSVETCDTREIISSQRQPATQRHVVVDSVDKLNMELKEALVIDRDFVPTKPSTISSISNEGKSTRYKPPTVVYNQDRNDDNAAISHNMRKNNPLDVKLLLKKYNCD